MGILQNPKIFHGAHSQNVELIASLIGGSHDHKVGIIFYWLSQTTAVFCEDFFLEDVTPKALAKR